MVRAKETNINTGIILKEDVIEPNQLSIGRAAELLGVSRLTLSKIANGSGSIIPNITLRIEKVFGGNDDFWLRMQRGYGFIEEKIEFEINPLKLTLFECSLVSVTLAK